MILRRLIASVLTLALFVTSGTMAVARGEMAQTAMLHVLCIDGAAQLVAIGPDGAPVEDHHACPDCVIGALADAGALILRGPVQSAARAADPAFHRAPLLPRQVAKAAPARAPPLSV